MRIDFEFFFFYFFCLCHGACGILVLSSEIKPAPLALEVQSLKHWSSGEIWNFYFKHH